MAKPRVGIAPTSLDIAYFAGIIDGEGSIMLMHHPAASGKHRWEYWAPRVTVSNTKRELMDWIIDRFGGAVTIGINRKPNQRDHLIWIARVADVRAILLAIRPFLVLKGRQADIVLSYISTHRLVGRRGHDKGLIEQRRTWAAEMKALNQRGRIQNATS